MRRLADSVRELGPYAAIAVVVPGGSLIALSVWAVRRGEGGRLSAKAVYLR